MQRLPTSFFIRSRYGIPQTRCLSSAVPRRPTAILHRTPWIPPVATSAHGVYVNLDDGRTIIDAVGGAAVTSVGQKHPKVIQAIKDQVDKITYVFNMQISNQPAEQLANRLIAQGRGAFELCGLFGGGAEAMESAIKLAIQYFGEINQPQRTNFIGRHLSFHGTSLGTLSLAHHPYRRAPYVKHLDGINFHHVSPAYAARFQKPGETEEEYVERLRQELESKFLELGPDTVIGFAAETVSGASTGCVPPPKGYFKAMKSVCDKYGALLILDEVMCGMGRVGTLHAWESFGVAPDIQAVAKGLGGGYSPIGAVLISPKVAAGFRGSDRFWKHGYTYQGHPLSCAAALAVQDVVESENLLENVLIQGNYLAQLLREGLQGPNAAAAPFTFDIRGSGLFWGVEFDFSNASHLDFKGDPFGARIQARAFENGLAIMGFSGGSNIEATKGDHCLLAPSYIVTRTEIEAIARIFIQSAEEVLREVSAV